MKNFFFLLSMLIVSCCVIPFVHAAGDDPVPPAKEPKTWAVPSDVPNKDLKLGDQLGTNPGGTLVKEDGTKCYVKYPEPNIPAKRNKLWGEALACKLYAKCNVSVPKVSIVSCENGEKEIRLESEFIEGWQKLEEHPEVLATVLGPKSKVKLSRIKGLYENFAVDAWMNAWDVVGMTDDNIGYVKEGLDYHFSRIDTGGAFNYRAMTAGTKTKAYGSKSFSIQVHSLKTMLDFSRNKVVFARMQVGHFYQGVVKLNGLSDKDLYNDIVRSGIGYKHQRVDLFMKMFMRKQNLRRYMIWLKKQKCDPKRSFIEVVHDPKLGLDAFLATTASSSLLYKHNVTKESSMEEIAWDVVSAHYLRSEDKGYTQLYEMNNTAKPEFPIKRVKHGGMHVVRAALAVEVIANLRKKAGDAISDEEVKMLQIATLFHDAGRKNDLTDDMGEWEAEGTRLCKKYLIRLGFDPMKAAEIAGTISTKDAPGRSLYQQILHDADCIDVLRSHNWLFNSKYLDLVKHKGISAEEITLLCNNYRQAVEDTFDAGRDWNGHERKFSLEKKRDFEHNPMIYSLIRKIFVKNELLV